MKGKEICNKTILLFHEYQQNVSRGMVLIYDAIQNTSFESQYLKHSALSSECG